MKFARMARVLAPPPDAQAALLVRDRWSAARRRSWCPVRKMWQRAEVRTVLTGRQHHRLRMLDDHLMCRDGVGRSAPGTKSCENIGSTTELSNRSWDVPQICKGATAPSGRRRRNRRSPGCVVERLLCPGSSASPCFTASCCRDGSLAVIQPLWARKFPRFYGCLKGIATVHTCAHSTSTSLGRHCNTTRPSQSSSSGSVHPHLAGQVTYVCRSFWHEKERSCPTACATSHLLVDRDRILRNWSIYQTSIRAGSVLVDQRWLQWVNKLSLALKAGNLNKKLRISITLQQQKYSRVQPTQRHDCVPNAPAPASIGCAVSEFCKKCRNEVSGKRSAVSQDTTRAVVWRPTTTLTRTL